MKLGAFSHSQNLIICASLRHNAADFPAFPVESKIGPPRVFSALACRAPFGLSALLSQCVTNIELGDVLLIPSGPFYNADFQACLKSRPGKYVDAFFRAHGGAILLHDRCAQCASCTMSQQKQSTPLIPRKPARKTLLKVKYFPTAPDE